MPKTWNRAPGAVEDLRVLAEELGGQLDAVISQARIERRFEDDANSTVRMVAWDVWKWSFPAEATPARRAAAESAAAAAHIEAVLAEQVQLLEGVLDVDNAAELWLVPDTNALLMSPALEEWEGDEPATIVIVPQVMRELDRHKLHHSNADVREKARKLIRRFDEYSRRGDTLEESVPLAGKLTYRDVVVDPDMRTTLPWLRADNADDQILASVLELRWHHPHRSITLVTEDQLLRGKARRARIATDRAPRPAHQEEQPRPARGRQRSILKVKNAWVEQRWPPQRPRSMPRLNILIVELVNIGEGSAADGTGTFYFHPYSNGTRMTLQSFYMPAVEGRGTWRLEHTLSTPPPGLVNAQNASIEGVSHDIDGNEYPLGWRQRSSGRRRGRPGDPQLWLQPSIVTGMRVFQLRQYDLPDVGDHLIHFTGRSGSSFDVPAEIRRLDPPDRLAQILHDGTIRAFPTLGTSYRPIVAFTESSEASVRRLITDRRYEPFGVGFSKQFIFDQDGGREEGKGRRRCAVVPERPWQRGRFGRFSGLTSAPVSQSQEAAVGANCG